MKKKFSYISLLLFLVSISACCTKKECVSVINGPDIKVSFQNFSAAEISKAKIYFLDKLSNQILDSSAVNLDEFVVINEAFIPSYSAEVLELKKYYFVVQTPVSSDTIHKFNFSTTADKVKCNTCFLARDIVNVSEINHFEMYHKGIKYSANELIVLNN